METEIHNWDLHNQECELSKDDPSTIAQRQGKIVGDVQICFKQYVGKPEKDVPLSPCHHPKSKLKFESFG
jgi:hypothetical protein